MANAKTERDILYQNGNFWVSAETFGTGRFKPKSKGYVVWECNSTHSVMVASFGFGPEWLKRAIAEADRRHNLSCSSRHSP